MPYYQPSEVWLKRFFDSDGDIRVLEQALEELEGKRGELESDPTASSQAKTKLENNIRVVQALPSFDRVRRVTGTVPVTRYSLEVSGVKVRSTPSLGVVLDGVELFVFLHQKAAAMDDGLARRTLELAYWVHSQHDRSLKMAQFEYWDLDANAVHRWPRHRKTTVKKAKQTLTVLPSVWSVVPPPPHWEKASAVTRQT